MSVLSHFVFVTCSAIDWQIVECIMMEKQSKEISSCLMHFFTMGHFHLKAFAIGITRGLINGHYIKMKKE